MEKTKVLSGYKLIWCYMGVFVILMGIIFLLPLTILPFYTAELVYAKNFVYPALICFVVGTLMFYPTRRTEAGKLENRQDMILVVLIWLICIVIGTLPFLLTKQYTFIECLFEMTSGFTTTGLSIIDYANTPKIYLFYRSISEFVGGVGFILILTCVMSDRYALKIYTNEGHSDRLLPNLAKSARLIFGIYCGYILIGTIGYTLCGMSVFDAINHSMAAVSNGGFSTRAENIGYYSGWKTGFIIELITIFLMFLGSINFLVHLYIITGKVKKVYNHCEIRFAIIVTVIGLILMNVCAAISGLTGFKGFREALFQFTSAFTTTGFQNVPDLNMLGRSGVFLMIILMVIGGELGSAAGGLKQYRVIIALKGLYYNIRDSIKDRRIIRSNYIMQTGQVKKLDDSEIKNNQSFIIMWLVTLVLGAFIICLPAQQYGYGIGDCLFEFASSLSGTGLSIGIVGLKNQFILFILSIGMFLGRLEITIILLALSRFIRDIFSKIAIKKNS